MALLGAYPYQYAVSAAFGNDALNPDLAPTPHYGDGGFLDSALNSAVYGLGGALDTFGEGLGVIGDTLGTPDIGIGEGLSSIGKSLEYGRAPTRDYSWEDIKSNPWGYITDPQGLTSTIGMTIGNFAPDLAAAALTMGAGTVASLGARGAIRAAGMAGRAASLANKAREVTEGSRLIGALADGGKVVGRFAANNALIGFRDETSEAGQTYQDALAQGMDMDSARESAMADFGGNLVLSTIQGGLEMGMLKGVMKAPGRLASDGVRAAEREGGGLMNAIANAGDKVADWSDTGLLKRFATRGIPGVAAEAYTEGLQNELENYSINDTQIEYNPFDMSDDSKTQMAQAAIGFGPMAFLGSIGHRRARRGESIEDTAEQLNAKDQSSIAEIQSPDMAREELRENAEGDSLAGLSNEDAATLYDGTVTNSPIAINDEITSEADLPTDQHVSELTNTLNTVSPRDAYERSLYTDDKGNVDPAFEKNQALANLALQLSGQTDADGNFRSFSVNPITESPHELKGEERKQAIQGLIQSQDFPEIQTPADAKGIIDIINGRAVDESNRAKANDLIAREKALGIETPAQYVNNADAASPNVGLITQHEEKVKRAEKQAKESQKNQEANVKTTRDDIKKDLRENGSKSIYYAPKGQLSESAQKELANRGIDISDKRIQNVINSESERATKQDQKLQRQKVASQVQAIKDDINKNGMKSEYMNEKNKTISALNLSTNQQQQINNAKLKALKKSKKQANGIIKDIKENGENSKYLPNTPEARENLSNTLKGLSVDDRNRIFDTIDSVGKVKEKQSQPKVNPLPKTEQKVSQLPTDKAPQSKPENRKNAHIILSGSKKVDGFMQSLHKSIAGNDTPVNRHRNAVIDSLLYPDKVKQVKDKFAKLYDQYKNSKVYDKALKNPDVVPSNVRSYYEVKDVIEKVKKEGKIVLRKTERDSYSNEELKKLEDLGIKVEAGDAKKEAEKAVTLSNAKFEGNEGSYDAKVNIPSGKIKDWHGKNVELSKAEIDDIQDYLEKTHKITSGADTKIEVSKDGKSVMVKNALATGSNEPDGFRESLTGKEKLAHDVQKKKNEEAAKEKEKIDEEGKKARKVQRKRKQKLTKDETEVLEGIFGKSQLGELPKEHIENIKDVIKKVFPNTKITNETGNIVEFTAGNGKKITFNVVDKVFLTDDQLAKAKEEHGIKDGENVSVLGYTQSKGGNIYVQLANGTGKGTVYHEAFHVAKMMGLSDKEIKVLERAFGTNEEVQANAYSDWVLGKSEIPKSSLFKRIWNKIKDVAAKLGIISERTPSVQEVFSKIKSGEVIERNTTPMDRIGKAQLKSEKEAVVGEQLKRHNVKDANDGMRGAILRGGLDSILGSKIKQDNKLGTIGRFLKNPQEIFENYLPKKAKHIYELADEAYRKSRDKTLEYTQKYLDIRKDLNKSQVAALDRLILYADKIGRSPMQVQKIGNVYLALDHNGYIEHYKTSVEAAQKVAELKKSGEYKMVGSIQDTLEDAGSESKRGFTVYALSKGSSAFKSEESANAFAKRNYARAVTGALNQLDGRYGDQSYKAENIKSVINAFAKNEKFFDDIYNDSVRAAIDAGAAIKLPKKRNGYFPHVHLPYVVMEKDKDGSWVRTNSFYNALDAEEYVQNINRGAEDGEIKAKSFKMTPMDTAALSTKLNNSERLTPKQIDELREEGYLKESDDVAEGEYNNQLKKAMLSTIFKDKDEIPVKVAMDRANAIMRKWKSDTKSEIHNRVVEMVKSQMKNTKLLDKLRKRSSGTITKNELAMLINNANMKAKFNPYFQGRLDNPETMNGFSKNVEDSTWRYLGTMANYVSKAKFKAEATASYKEMYGRDIEDAPATNEQKFLKTYIKTIEAPRSVSAFDNLVNQVMVDFIGKIENRSGALGKFARRHHTDTPYFDLTRKAIRTQNYTKLGMANPSAMIVQAAQLLNANAKIGQNYLLKGIKLQGKSDKYADLFKHVGIDERSMAVEAEDIGHIPGTFEKKRKLLGGHSLEDVAEKSMYFFNKGDIFARKATAIGAYMKGKDDFDNLSKEKKNAIYNKIVKKSNGKISMSDVKEKFAMDYAKKTVTETNFDYSPVNSPQAFAMAGQTGKLFLQFQKYPLFTINFMRNNSLKENVKFLVPMLILTGATGMPAADLFDDAVDGITGTSPGLMMRKAMINWAGGSASKKALVNVALYGAPTLAGINLSSRIGMGDALSPSLGPTYSTAKGIGQAVMGADSIPEAFTGVLKQIAPRAGQIQAAVSGDYKNSYGETVSHYSATDRFMKLLGFKPVSENNAADANKVLGIMKKKYTAEVAKAKKDYIKNPTSENYDALKIYGMTDAQIIKMLKTKDTAAIDTKLKSIPKKNKELQDLAKSAKAFSE